MNAAQEPTERASGWFAVANSIIDGATLDPYAGWLYCVLLRHADKDSRCWPSLDRLACLTGMSRRQVTKTLKRLNDQGVISIEARSGGSNVYRLTRAPGARLPAHVVRDPAHLVRDPAHVVRDGR